MTSGKFVTLDIGMTYWPWKVGAGVFLGAGISVGIMGDLGLVFHADPQMRSAAALLLRWLPTSVWALIISFCFLFRSAWRAWFFLSIYNFIIWVFFGIYYSYLS